MTDKPPLEFVVSWPAVRPPPPRHSLDFMAAMSADPNVKNLLRLAEQAPQLESKEVQRGDSLLMETENGEKYIFVCDFPRERTKHAPMTGVLFVPSETVGFMGIPQAIEGATISGCTSVGSSSLFQGLAAAQGMEVECNLPLARLGPIINPQDQEWSLLFKIPPLAKAVLLHPNMIPNSVKEGLRETFALISQLPKPTESQIVVKDWPGIKKGIDEKRLLKALYIAGQLAGMGIRGRYWVHPETGALSKCGKYLTKTPTVWSVAGEYAVDYAAATKRKDKKDASFSLDRVAPFTWWALRLGLRPPVEFMETCRDAGLEFKLPR